MKKFIAPALLATALGLPLAFPHSAQSDEVRIEKKTTTSPGDVLIEKKTTTTAPSGRFVVESETTRSFRIDGQPKIYVAPADVDIKEYVGKEVSVQVDPSGRVTKIEKRTTTTVD